MYRPSSKLSGKPRIVRRSELPPPPFHLELALRSAGVVSARHPLPLRNLEKRGRRGGTNVFPCLFIVLCSNDREENEKSGIPDYPARNKASFRNEQGSEKLEIRASHAGGKEEGRKEEGKIKEEGSGREFCRRFEKLPTIPRSRGVERN